MTSRPCSVILSELCRHIIDDPTSVTSTKRGACIAAHSIYLNAREDADGATQDLHEALLSTVVAQLAAPDTGRYQGTVKNIILAAATPQDKPTLGVRNNLDTHFLRLAINTPLSNLSETARQFAISIIREHASISPDSDWTKAAGVYNLTTIPRITSSSHTVSRELDKPTVRNSKDPIHCWFHNVNGFVARWNEPAGDIKKIIAEAGFPDFFAFQEAKASWFTILSKCPGFLEWLEAHGYNYTYCSWSTRAAERDKNLSGFAGILVVSRIKPNKVIYGFAHKPSTGAMHGLLQQSSTTS